MRATIARAPGAFRGPQQGGKAGATTKGGLGVPFNPADFSDDELCQIEAALRLIVERNAEKARALTAT